MHVYICVKICMQPLLDLSVCAICTRSGHHTLGYKIIGSKCWCKRDESRIQAAEPLKGCTMRYHVCTDTIQGALEIVPLEDINNDGLNTGWAVPDTPNWLEIKPRGWRDVGRPKKRWRFEPERDASPIPWKKIMKITQWILSNSVMEQKTQSFNMSFYSKSTF